MISVATRDAYRLIAGILFHPYQLRGLGYQRITKSLGIDHERTSNGSAYSTVQQTLLSYRR